MEYTQRPNEAYVYPLKIKVLLGNDIDQTAKTYNLNAFNKALIKTSKAKLKQLSRLYCKNLLIFVIVNQVIIFNMLQKIYSK